MTNKKIIRNLRFQQRKSERLLTAKLRLWLNFTTRQLRKDIGSSGRFRKDEAYFGSWSLIEKKGNSYLQPVILEIYLSGQKQANKILGITTEFEVYNIAAVKAAEEICSELVTGITEATRKAINVHIAAGIESGQSMYDVGRELRTVVGLNAPQATAVRNFRIAQLEKYPNITTTQLNRKVLRYSKKKLKLRTETIARTESARAQTVGYCNGLHEEGVTEVEFSASPTACEEQCQPLNGTIYSVAEGKGVIPVHPNCTCCLLPVIE